MITLYGFGERLGVPDLSPFVVRIDAYLRMRGIEFERNSGLAYFRKAPKGKLPYITDDGRLIADSFFIIEYLENKFGDDFDSHLSPQQKATADLFEQSLAEGFYWTIVKSRWSDDDIWPHFKEAAFAQMPWPMKLIVPTMARRGVKSSLQAQGLGRHSNAEILQIADRTLNDLSLLLGEQAFFFGHQPATFDAMAFGCLVQLTHSELSTPLAKQAAKYANLHAYCDRILQRYY